MASPALPLSDIVDVVVQVSPQSAVAPQFNQAIIIGPSTVIPSQTQRVRQYSSLTQMLTDGFTSSSPEYIKAELMQGQSPAAQYWWIGRQDLTSLQTVVPHSGNAGLNYVVGDVITVVQGGASGGKVTVATIGAGGAVTGLTVNTANDGTGYSVANGLTTTGGSGTGLEVDISAVGESYLVAIENCRIASSIWWGVTCCGATTADAEAIAPFVQSMQPVGCYFHTTGDAAVLNNTTGNLAATLKAASYTRVFLVYSTTQGGTAPNNIYADGAALGVAMGLNTGLPNSAFTLMFKPLVGVIPEPLTQSQVTTLTSLNVNFYVGYANSYTILQNGTSPTTATWFDQVLNRDILVAAMQYNVMNLLVGSPKVPQTDPGETQLIDAVNQACQAGVLSGYLAPGVWEGDNILGIIYPGKPLPAGFLAVAASYNTQSAANRAARQAMPIYVAVREAGAVNSLLIGLYIQP